MRRETGASRFSAVLVVVMIAAAKTLAEEKGVRPAEPTTAERTEPVRRIVISIPDRKLALIIDGRIVKTFPTAVGAPSSRTPSGIFTIANRISKPTYYAPRKIVPPGPANPLGTRWLGLSVKSFGIHGTNAVRSIGKAASHGCIRMTNRDVEELFELVRVGDTVEIHDARDAEVARIFPISDPAGVVKDAAVAPVTG